MKLLKSATDLFYDVLGNWWAFGILFVLSGIMFGYLTPRAQKPIFAHVTTDLPAKVLDVHFLTWTPVEARRLLEGIGPQGRRAYQNFYLYLDFWFPTLITSLTYCSFLALAFPQGTRFAWLAPLGMLGWLFDVAENVNHYTMARDYPDLSRSALKFGPRFTYWKWVLAIVTPMIGAAGFVARLI
jgi:hypothetical protein